LNVAAGPFSSIYTTLSIVEWKTVCIGSTLNSTPLVVGLVGGVNVTVGGRLTVCSGGPVASHVVCVGVHGATVVSVKGGSNNSLSVDTFNDVNLTTVGPVRTHHPPSWPRSAALRHVS